MSEASGKSFKLRLTKDEWDPELRGWYCSALKIPGAVVKEIYSGGQPVNRNLYRIDQTNEIIQWLSGDPPETIAVIVTLTVELSTEAETAKWKKLAIVLPVLATVLSPLLVALFNYATSEPKKPVPDCVSTLGPWVIGLETISEADGGKIAARNELFDKAKKNGYEHNSCLLKYGDIYKVIIHFQTAEEAQNNLEKAKAINPTVSRVVSLSDFCGGFQKIEDDLYNCSKDISKE